MSLVSESIFGATDALLVPMVPTTLSARTLEQLVSFLKDRRTSKLDILSFFSLSDRRKRLHREVMETLHPKGVRMMTAAIPSSTYVEQMGVHRSPVAEYSPRSAAARGYEQLWGEVRDAVG
jgi:cellulose biosynthesis protein BcsQ